MRMKVYEIDGTFLGSIDSSGYPQYLYDYNDSPMAWVGPIEEERTGLRIVWSTTGHNPRAGQVKPTRFSNGKKGGIISPENIWLADDGYFWRYVGHDERRGAIQKLGWMTPTPSDPSAVAAAAYFFTRSVFFFRDGPYGIYLRKPLWHDVDPRYFRCSCHCSASPVGTPEWP